jgi:hypothetical protein
LCSHCSSVPCCLRQKATCTGVVCLLVSDSVESVHNHRGRLKPIGRRKDEHGSNTACTPLAHSTYSTISYG